jgi:hypothetical protein
VSSFNVSAMVVMALGAGTIEFKVLGLYSDLDVDALEEPYRSTLLESVKFSSS